MIKNEILTRLRNNEPLSKIRKDFRSLSQLYEALREYLEELSKIADAKREALGLVQEQLDVKQAELEKANQEKETLEKENVEQRLIKEDLVAGVKSATQKRDRLRAEVKELEAKGFTTQIVKKLGEMEAKSGAELLLQVKTAEKYVHLKTEFSNLQIRKASLEKEIGNLETRKKNIEQMIVSEKNGLDELKVQTASYKAAVKAVESLFAEGLTRPEDIKSLAYGLRTLGIKGNPRASVTRLVTALEKMKTISAIEEKLQIKTEKLDMYTKAVALAKSELETLKEVAMKTIEEVLNTSVQAIRNTGQQANAQMQIQIRQVEEKYRVVLEELNRLEHRKGEAEAILGPGLALVGILNSPEYLKVVPAPFIMELLDRIQLWFETNLPNSSVSATASINAKEFNLLTFQQYKLPVLIELAKEGLKQFVMRQKT